MIFSENRFTLFRIMPNGAARRTTPGCLHPVQTRRMKQPLLGRFGYAQGVSGCVPVAGRDRADRECRRTVRHDKCRLVEGRRLQQRQYRRVLALRCDVDLRQRHLTGRRTERRRRLAAQLCQSQLPPQQGPDRSGRCGVRRPGAGEAVCHRQQQHHGNRNPAPECPSRSRA